jgi:hypothetical protein
MGKSADRLARFACSLLQSVERILGECAVVTQAFDFEELAIHLFTGVAEKREILEALERERWRRSCCSPTRGH